MGRNFGERLRPGLPPPPGSPAAQGLGCTCPFEKNRDLAEPSNRRRPVWFVASHCPMHGWIRDVDPGPLNRATVIQTIAEALPALRERFKVKELWLFGSVARGEANLDSDVDLMVEYQPGGGLSFGELFDLREALEDALGVKVDLGNRKDLDPRVKDRVAEDMIRIEASS